jgi:predicted nucleic acid-binding Zn ribbon protein
MKAAIEQLLDAYKLSDQFIIEKIKLNWPELVGKVIANRTDEINIRQQKLYLKVSSASLRQELIMMKSTLIENVNTYAGKKLINEIVLL